MRGGGILHNRKTFALQRINYMKKTFIVLIMVLLSAILLVSCDDNKNTSSKKISKIGETIELGKTKAGKAITWEALDVDTNKKKALLISQDILEKRVFSSSSSTADYKDSDIRAYLTSTASDGFIKTYDLSTTYMIAADLSDVNAGNEDYVFLFSEAEVTAYFSQEADRVAQYNGTATEWWLRSHKGGEGEVVGDDGVYGQSPTNPYERGLRPAFWYTWD